MSNHWQESESYSKHNIKRDRIELVIFGDSITKYISPERIEKSDISNAANYSKSGAKVRGIYDQFRQFQSEHGNGG